MYDDADPLQDVLKAESLGATKIKRYYLHDDTPVPWDYLKKLKSGNLYNIIHRIHHYSYDKDIRFWKMFVSLYGPDRQIIYLILIAHCSKHGFFTKGFCDLVMSYNYRRLLLFYS